jgi:hypothetical protein
MEKVNLAEKFARISEYWKPYIAAELNANWSNSTSSKVNSSGTITNMKMKCSWW